MLNKISISALALILAFVASSFVASDQYKYKSSAGKMSITFPASFQEEESELESGTIMKISASVGNVIYYASYTQHEVDLVDKEELAQVSLTAFVENTGGNIITQKEWVVKKNKGLEATIEIEESNTLLVYKVVLVGRIQYQLVVGSPKDEWNQNEADRFFRTFTLL